MTTKIEKGKLGIYAKLLEVKKAVPYLKKDDKTYQYTYATPEAVLGTLNPLLNAQGIFLKTEVIDSKSDRIDTKDKNGVHQENLYHLKMRYTWIDTESGENIEQLFEASGCNGEEKGLGSALTYAERYFMLKTFNIPTGDDDPDRHNRVYGGSKAPTQPTKPTAPAKKPTGFEGAKAAVGAIKTKAQVESVKARIEGHKDLTQPQKDELIGLIAEKAAKLNA